MLKYISKLMEEKDQASNALTILEALVKDVGGYEKERSHKVVHASDVTKPSFCPRQYRLMDVLEVNRPDSYIGAGLRATFDTGNAVASLVVNKWLVNRVRGKWKCSGCGVTTSGFGKYPSGCAGCNGKDFTYVESMFLGNDSAISGSIDLLLDLGNPKLTVVELKIIKSEDFNKLVAPLAEHRLRTRLYLKLIEGSDNPARMLIDTTRAKVLYTSRGFGKMNSTIGQILPFLEFDVERDDPSIGTYLALGTEVKKHRELNTVPSFKVCQHISDTKSKGCPVRKECWSGEYL